MVFSRPHRRRLLLVGYGQRGRQWHEACRRRRDVAVVGAVDPDGLAQEAARRSGLPIWSTLEEVVELGGGEAAIVASPPWEHPGQTIACLRLGMAVLVEKPFALSLEAAARVAQESTRLGVPVAVVQNFRFLRRERAVRKALAAGVGKPLSATIVSARPRSAAMPHLAAVEHGALWDICIHHLDALRVRFGEAPEKVAMTVTRLGESPGDARARFQILLEWREGPAVVYQHSEGAPGYYHSEWIEGERRAVVVHDQSVSVLFPRHRARRVIAPRGPKPEQAVLDDFLGALRSGNRPTLSAEDNLLTVATVEAALRAEALGRAVTLAEVGEAAGVALGARRSVDE
jgi:predicted dehydrogenase